MGGGILMLRLVQGTGGTGSRPQLEFAVLTGAILLGVFAAAAIGFVATRPFTEQWRRGATAAIGVFCAVLLATLSAPVDIVAGLPGLMVYTALLIVGASGAWRVVRRVAAE